MSGVLGKGDAGAWGDGLFSHTVLCGKKPLPVAGATCNAVGHALRERESDLQ